MDKFKMLTQYEIRQKQEQQAERKKDIVLLAAVCTVIIVFAIGLLMIG